LWPVDIESRPSTTTFNGESLFASDRIDADLLLNRDSSNGNEANCWRSRSVNSHFAVKARHLNGTMPSIKAAIIFDSLAGFTAPR
jgi:hypothetical protein